MTLDGTLCCSAEGHICFSIHIGLTGDKYGQTIFISPGAVHRALADRCFRSPGTAWVCDRGAAASVRRSHELGDERPRALAGRQPAPRHAGSVGGGRSSGLGPRGLRGPGAALPGFSAHRGRTPPGSGGDCLSRARRGHDPLGLAGPLPADRLGTARLRRSGQRLPLGESGLHPDPGPSGRGKDHCAPGSGPSALGSLRPPRGPGRRARGAGRLPGWDAPAQRGSADRRPYGLSQGAGRRAGPPLHGPGVDRCGRDHKCRRRGSPDPGLLLRGPVSRHGPRRRRGRSFAAARLPPFDGGKGI